MVHFRLREEHVQGAQVVSHYTSPHVRIGAGQPVGKQSRVGSLIVRIGSALTPVAKAHYCVPGPALDGWHDYDAAVPRHLEERHERSACSGPREVGEQWIVTDPSEAKLSRHGRIVRTQIVGHRFDCGAFQGCDFADNGIPIVPLRS